MSAPQPPSATPVVLACLAAVVAIVAVVGPAVVLGWLATALAMLWPF